MQLTRETLEDHTIRAWEAGRVRIAGEWFTGHVIVSAERVITDWQITAPEQIGIAELEPVLALQPDIILLGTGEQRVLPDVLLMGELADRAIGLEIMGTPAACRTFNVLLHEQRRVVAALYNPAPPP